MASALFKVSIVKYWLYNRWIDPNGNPCEKNSPGARFVKRRRVRPGTPGAVQVKKKSSKWYGRIPGRNTPVPLYTDKVASGQRLAELVRSAEKRKTGLGDPYEEHNEKPLFDHLKDWENALRAKDRNPKHIRHTVGSVRRLLEACRFVLIPDLSASAVEQYLAGLRANARELPPLDPAKAWYKKAELATLLGVKPGAIAPLVRRHRLEAVGNGKKRCYPKATAETLRSLRDTNRSLRTSNFHLGAIKAICRWLVKDRRMCDNPLVHLEGHNERLDRRHDRQTLSPDQLARILAAAQTSQRSFRGLSGPDRHVLYLCAMGTGLRASELAILCPESFVLDSAPPPSQPPTRRIASWPSNPCHLNWLER